MSRLEKLAEKVSSSISNKESKAYVTQVYHEYIEAYKNIKAPKTVHMEALKNVFFDYFTYMNTKDPKEHKN